MFPRVSNNQKEVYFSSKYRSGSADTGTEDDDYEEAEERYNILDDGISLDETIDDEYSDFEDELEVDNPPYITPEVIKSPSSIDEVEAEHYDSIDDE